MPIYEYRCEACGEQFSKLQKMGAGEGETTCPKCGSGEVRRQISGCSIGSGEKGGASGPACGIGGG
jgi:putative FmdB family regulatory protein